MYCQDSARTRFGPSLLSYDLLQYPLHLPFDFLPLSPPFIPVVVLFSGRMYS
jgi:hypothetical protein